MPRPSQSELNEKIDTYLKICKKFHIKPLEKISKLGEIVPHRCYCGEIWNVSASKVSIKPRCNTCAYKGVGVANSAHRTGSTPSNKISKEDFVERLKNSNTGRKLVGPFNGTSHKSKFVCTSCSAISETTSTNALRSGCRQCSGMSKKSTEQHRQELQGTRIDLISDYLGARIQSRYRCSTCRFEWNSMPTNILKEKVKCPSCSPFKSVCIHTHVHKGTHYKLRSKGELEVLKILLKTYKSSDVDSDLSQGTPTIALPNGSKHRPDFYIKSKNKLVEVKGEVTAGLKYANGIMGKHQFVALKRKRKSAIQQGFKYEVVIVHGWRGEFLKLPKNWHELSTKEMKSYVKEKECYLPLSKLKL